MDKIKELAKARHKTSEEFLKTAIEFYDMWSPLIGVLKELHSKI